MEHIKVKNVNFIKENLKDNSKNGFTIIEIVMTLAIICIITTVQTCVILKYMKLNREEINLSRDKFYTDEAFEIMKSQIDSAKYIRIKNNMIEVNRFDNKGWDYIKRNKRSDIVITYGYTNFEVSNNILRNVAEFNVTNRNNICYIYIKTKEGNVYKKCFGIDREKVKEDSY
nr:type II secretion system protein [Clostridium algifaecis]